MTAPGVRRAKAASGRSKDRRRTGNSCHQTVVQTAERGRAIPLGDISFEPLWTEGFYVNLG
jgi:hypothetical protein